MVVVIIWPTFCFSQFGNLGKKLQDKAAEAIKEKVIEKTDEKQSEYDTSSFNYAIAFLDKTESFQNQQKGERLVKTAGFLIKESNEKSDSEKARDLYELGRINYSKRNYYLGEIYLTGAKIAYELIPATSDPVYLKTLGSLGLLYSDMGRFDKAEELTLAAKQGWEATNGKSSSGYAAEANNAGVLAFNQGNYSEAEKLLRASKGYIGSVEGKASTPYAIALNNLGILYQYMGRYSESLNEINQCLTIAEEELRDNSGTYVQFLTNKALVQQEMGDYTGAEATYEQALDLQTSRLKLNRKSDPDYAHMLNNLASLYTEVGKLEEAEKLLKESLEIYINKFSEDHLSTATAKSDLGKLFLYQGKYQEAEPELVSAHGVMVSKLGEEHPKTVKAKENLAVVYWKTGAIDKASEYFDLALGSSLAFINKYFPPLSEVEKTKYWDQLKPRFYTYYNFVIENADSNPELLEKFINYRIATKGLLLSATTKIRNAILNSGNQDLVDLYEQWQDQKRMLATYYSFSKAEISEQKINIDSLESAANDSEKLLSEKSSDFANSFISSEITYQEVANQLSADAALVEIVHLPIFNNSLSTAHTYVAILLDQKGKPRLVRLPDGTDFDAKSFKLYKNLIKQKLPDEYSYNQFWQPIANELGSVSKVWLSPDGVYNQVNLNTLRKPSGGYFISDYDLRIVGNPKDLMNKEKSKTKTASKALLVGFPNYGSSDVTPLPGTKKEVQMVSEALGTQTYRTELLMENEATESAIKGVSQPGIMHIATHGFFLEDQESGGKVFGVQIDQARSNPLLRAGLMLAGASGALESQSFDRSDNGILTAYEAMNLSLTATDLVVLSACETGKGDIKSGEGVYGLQRAFMVAGASKMIMSLWKVDDEATQKLMSQFYDLWVTKHQPIQTAFRNAQLSLMKSYDHPYYWGAFVMVE